jgi:hypothetical protein
MILALAFLSRGADAGSPPTMADVLAASRPGEQGAPRADACSITGI